MKEKSEVLSVVEPLPKVNWFRVFVGELDVSNFAELQRSLVDVQRTENLKMRLLKRPEVLLKIVLVFSYHTDAEIRKDAYIVDSSECFQELSTKYFSKPQPSHIAVHAYAVREDDLKTLLGVIK